jgi:murein DD-endopeptidase MepM/ murein hydrolase activator NlpD
MSVFAQTASSTVSALQNQIDEHNSQITKLNTEIAQYQQQLTQTGKKKQTLQNTLHQVDLSLKKTTSSIALSKNQISATQLQIQQLANDIATKQRAIQKNHAALAESLRTLNTEETVPLSIALLSAHTMSRSWDDITAIESLRDALGNQVGDLKTAQESLTQTKNVKETKRAELVVHEQTLEEQKGTLSATKQTQSEILAQTKAQEATYQKIIADKKKQEASFEAALSDLKSQMNQAVNPDQITAASAGTLQWPIAGSVILTQFFGNTAFSSAHSALYNGHGHNGLDMGAPIGTPMHAALGGTILGTGNTDAVAGCYSFGKWVMIKHNNGLNTMYAHLSQISVSAGQSVSTGDVVGYSGETGYATGPHLHFGVYVSSVTKIINLGSATRGKTACSGATMPVPPVSGYLNPLNYLPSSGYTVMKGA